MAYEVDDMIDFDYLMHSLPYEIIPGEERSLRSSIFLGESDCFGAYPPGDGPFPAPD